MKIYTSYYRTKPEFELGPQIGESFSISLYPPKGFTGKHLPLFAPSEDLLNFWKKSKKDAIAQAEYTKIFFQEMEGNRQFIDVWLNKFVKNAVDVTLNCYWEKFCHRHLVKSIILERNPDLWGGEVSELKIDVQSPIPDTQPLTPDPSIFEWLERDRGIKLYDPNPNPPASKPWRVGLNVYAIYGNDLVKVVGGEMGSWQTEKRPQDNANQAFSFNVATKELKQPPPGHETWTDADFKKMRNKAMRTTA